MVIKTGVELTFHQARQLAEKMLGIKKAQDLFKNLRAGKQIILEISETNGARVHHTVTWGIVQYGEAGITHFYTSYRPLWHVEFRQALNWERTHDDVQDYFCWMALALLSMPNPYRIPGVPEAKCISIWPQSGMFGVVKRSA